MEEGTLEGKKVFITGVTSGLGKAIAYYCLNNGADILVLIRDRQEAKDFMRTFRAKHPESLGIIEVAVGDLSDFKFMTYNCDKINLSRPRIDYVIHNAATINSNRTLSVDNIELSFQVNLLSPLLVTNLVKRKLYPSEDPRIIFTTSSLNQNATFDMANFKLNDGFNPLNAYNQTKIGALIASKYLARSLERHNIDVYSYHPGTVKTNIGRQVSRMPKPMMNLFGAKPEKGIETLIHLIESPRSSLESGGHYYKKKLVDVEWTEEYKEKAQQLFKYAAKILEPHIDYYKFLNKKNY